MMRKPSPAMLLELVVNFLLPWAAYRLAAPHWGQTGGLIASAIPPVLWSIVELARFRRVDALSALVLLGIALSIGALAAGGGPRVLLLRESLVTGAIGLVFLLSLALRRPLAFYLARATIARERADGVEFAEQLWRDSPAFVRTIRLMTGVWGAGLAGETALRAWLAWTWPIERFLIVSPFIGYGIYGSLMLWTLWYRTRARRRVRAQEAAQQAPQAGARAGGDPLRPGH